MKNKFNLQLFAVTQNTTVANDLEPAISVDHTSRLHTNVLELTKVLGLADLVPMTEGTQIKTYKLVKTNSASQPAEGDAIPLTKIERKLANTYDLVLKKYRKATTAEAIQKVGYDKAVNDTDGKLILEVQKDIKKDFYAVLKTGTGELTAQKNLQTACANLWAKLQIAFEDEDVTPIYFINPQDVADYLSGATISMQNAFGFSYIENFLGMGNAIITTGVEAKKPIATAVQNIAGAYVPTDGVLGATFGLTADETGYVGMTHTLNSTNATFETLLMSGVKIYVERVDAVYKATMA